MKKETSITFAFLIAGMGALCYSCKKTPDEKLPAEPVPITLTADQRSLIESENTFAFEIFKRVLADSPENKNIIISPLSISTALSMTLNGADGTTRDAMLEALRVNGMSPDIINNSYRNLSDALLTVDPRVLISIANSVWSEKKFEVKIPFKDILTSYYNAESRTFDGTDPAAYQEINAWIDIKTNGLIKNMLDGLDTQTVMLLINAIYFKGKWKSEFDKANTVNGPFHKPDGTIADAPMMKKISDYKVYQGDGFVMAEFPYGQGNYVMDVILPESLTGTAALTPLLNDVSFNGLIGQMAESEANLTFPRFKYGFKEELNNILTDMGMGIAFTDSANFSNISDISLKISQVLHQALIETNEEGTEAAAATIVEIVPTSMPSRVVLTLDHSFLYIIRETSTNAFLFMGKVADPLAN